MVVVMVGVVVVVSVLALRVAVVGCRLKEYTLRAAHLELEFLHHTRRKLRRK